MLPLRSAEVLPSFHIAVGTFDVVKQDVHYDRIGSMRPCVHGNRVIIGIPDLLGPVVTVNRHRNRFPRHAFDRELHAEI